MQTKFGFWKGIRCRQNRTGAKTSNQNSYMGGKSYHMKKDLDYLISPLYIIGEFEVTWSNYVSSSQRINSRCSVKINCRSSTTSTCLTWCNIYKLTPVFCKYDLRKYYFTNRVVPIWNSLLNTVVSADLTNLFKFRSDKFWKSYDLVYDYKAQPFSTGSQKLFFLA